GTGLFQYRARYFDPTLQRFIGEDPIGFAGGAANLHGYVGNAPTIWTDPLGLKPSPGFGRPPGRGPGPNGTPGAPPGSGPGRGDGPDGTPPQTPPNRPDDLPPCTSVTVQGNVGSISIQQPRPGAVQWGVTMDVPIVGVLIVSESYRTAGAPRPTT